MRFLILNKEQNKNSCMQKRNSFEFVQHKLSKLSFSEEKPYLRDNTQNIIPYKGQ
jgi:hypothetical protein